jgi:hypothetical protein
MWEAIPENRNNNSALIAARMIWHGINQRLQCYSAAVLFFLPLPDKKSLIQI